MWKIRKCKSAKRDANVVNAMIGEIRDFKGEESWEQSPSSSIWYDNRV